MKRIEEFKGVYGDTMYNLFLTDKDGVEWQMQTNIKYPTDTFLALFDRYPDMWFSIT